jgi:hypothetical protein
VGCGPVFVTSPSLSAPAPAPPGGSLRESQTPDIEPIVVLDLIMPNGKRMRDCTGADMKKFGDLLLKRSEFLLKQAEQPKT